MSSLFFLFMSLLSAEPQSGKTTDIAFIRDRPKPFTYRPVNNRYWERVQTHLKENNPLFILQEAHEQQKTYGFTSTESQESHLAEAIGLKKLSFSYASFVILLNLAQTKMGTNIGEAALFELEDLALHYSIDESQLESFLNQNEFADAHHDIVSFINYYKGLHNLRYGYKKWAEPSLSGINPASPWSLQLNYWTAMGEVARGRMDKAFEMLRTLNTSANIPQNLQNMVKLQLARIYFEKGLFQEAESFYQDVGDMGLREHGRILLERAWTAYYLKNFSQALGWLTALKSSTFDSSLTPERYILEMVILRDLCHFPGVEIVAKAFEKKFRHTLSVIRKRGSLREERTLFSMATLNRDLQPQANLVDQLRKERDRFQRAGMQKFLFFDDALDEYKKRDKILTANLEPRLENFARKSAESVLDSEEQIQFLQYQSKLDALRIIKADEDRAYRAEKVSHVAFQKLYWPVEKEFWLEEQNDYRVLISSRCGTNATPEDLKLERKFR